MISIDTTVLRDLVNAASSVNEAVNDAAEVLYSITTHNSWGCRERDAINDYTAKNKTKIKTMKENTDAFYHIIRTITGEFENTERSIADLFGSVESVISSVISIPVISPVPISSIGEKMRTAIEDLLHFLDPPVIPEVHNPFDDIIHGTPDPVIGIDNWGIETPGGIGPSVWPTWEGPVSKPWINEHPEWYEPVISSSGEEMYIFSNPASKVIRSGIENIFEDIKAVDFSDLAL